MDSDQHDTPPRSLSIEAKDEKNGLRRDFSQRHLVRAPFS
jgi:hypothetical protein